MKKNIAVIYGGFSAEHHISVKSGKFVSSIIDKEKYNVFEILINKNSWIEQSTGKSINKDDFSVKLNHNIIKFNAAVNVIHGNPGENGIVQSYFDMINIPYTGCNSFVSALTFNKYYCNKYLLNFDINIANSLIIRKGNIDKEKIQLFIDKVGLPVFVKPSDGGSSFGTTKVKNQNDIENALNSAFEHSNEVMIEQFIEGREFTCGVIKTNKTLALTPIEVRSKKEFFDYESKYNSSLNEEIIPAPIDQLKTNIIKNTSEKIYDLLNCNGIVRMDYIFNEKTNKFYFLEVNTIPGMTSESLVPKMLRYDNIDITNLYTDLIESIL